MRAAVRINDCWKNREDETHPEQRILGEPLMEESRFICLPNVFSVGAQCMARSPEWLVRRADHGRH